MDSGEKVVPAERLSGSVAVSGTISFTTSGCVTGCCQTMMISTSVVALTNDAIPVTTEEGIFTSKLALL